jgi:hypothetical protein
MKLTAHIHFVKYSWDEGQFLIYGSKLKDSEHCTYVCSQEVEIDIPENYDPRAQQIAALEKQKQKAMADFQKSVDDINERISKLQALEYTA